MAAQETPTFQSSFQPPEFKICSKVSVGSWHCAAQEKSAKGLSDSSNPYNGAQMKNESDYVIATQELCALQNYETKVELA